MTIYSHQSPPKRPSPHEAHHVDWAQRIASHPRLLRNLREAALRGEIPSRILRTEPGDVFDDKRFAIVAWMAMPGVSGLFDFDGTVAPITPNPSETTMRPATRELLHRAIDAGVEVRVASGREYSDAVARFQGTGVKKENVIGNHGIQFAGTDLAPVELVAKVDAWISELGQRLAKAGFDLAQDEGFVVENKGTTFSISCAAVSADRREEAKQVIQGFLDGLGTAVHLQHSTSPYGWDVLPEETSRFSKGTAAQMMKERDHLVDLVAVGDAPNDASMMDWANQRGGGVSIRVGEGVTNARFFIENQAEVDEFLEGVVEVAEFLHASQNAPKTTSAEG